MYNLSSRKIIILFSLLLVVAIQCVAQNPFANTDKNMPDYEERNLHYGFSVGLNNSRFAIRHSDYFINNRDEILSVTPVPTTSFTLGFILNMHLNDIFDLRALPNVGFYNRDMLYEFVNEDKLTSESPLRQLESTVIELPLLFKYKSYRHKNFRVYVVGGIKPGIEVNNKRKQDRETILRVKSGDLSVEYGVGLDIYNPMFKFSPEIRFSHGLPNQLVPDANVFAESLSRISTHTITLFFHFE